MRPGGPGDESDVRPARIHRPPSGGGPALGGVPAAPAYAPARRHMSLLKPLKQLRKHFGVSAPKLSVKTHVAWPWRALGIGCVLAIVGWMVWTGFDAGR